MISCSCVNVIAKRVYIIQHNTVGNPQLYYEKHV
jgi:hypothetical protein